MDDLINDITNDVRSLNVGGLWFHSLENIESSLSPTKLFLQMVAQILFISKAKRTTKHVSWIYPPCQFLKSSYLIGFLNCCFDTWKVTLDFHY